MFSLLEAASDTNWVGHSPMKLYDVYTHGPASVLRMLAQGHVTITRAWKGVLHIRSRSDRVVLQLHSEKMAKTGVSLAHARELEGRKEQPDPAPQSRDFFWDSITLYIVGVILALTAIDVVSEFIRGADVQCYQPNETQSDILSSVQNYVNEFCRGHVPTLQFLPSFIAIHAIAILLPHYAWLNAYGADLDFFFRHVSKLERNRKEDTGDYPAINYTISKEMEEAFSKYGKPNGMYWSYIAKILFQIVLCILGIILVPLVFFKYSEQNVAFQCPESESDAKGDSWPLPYRETVTCVFSPMNLLQRIWLVYLFLLAVAALFMLINLIQLAKWHTNELGLKNCAKFSFQTGLSYHYCHPSVKKVFKRNIAKRDSSSLLYPFSPYSIESNYDFLIVKLFRTEGGLAYIMKEVHVLRLLREMNKTDLTIVNLYRLGDTGSDVKGKGKHIQSLSMVVLITKYGSTYHYSLFTLRSDRKQNRKR